MILALDDCGNCRVINNSVNKTDIVNVSRWITTADNPNGRREIIGTSRISQLLRGEIEVDEVREGMECIVKLEDLGFVDGDLITVSRAPDES